MSPLDSSSFSTFSSSLQQINKDEKAEDDQTNRNKKGPSAEAHEPLSKSRCMEDQPRNANDGEPERDTVTKVDWAVVRLPVEHLSTSGLK